MASKVDMALDDIIKAKKISIRGARGARGGTRGRGTGRGGAFRGRAQSRGRGNFRGTSRGSFRGVSRGPYRGLQSRGRGGFRGASNGTATVFTRPVSTGPTKINITNLEYGVSDADIRELFQEFGEIRGAAVHYDRTGRSLGTAHVQFARYGDAVKAIKQYNGVHLDGRPMNISIDGQQRLQTAVSTAGQRGAFRGMSASRRPVKRITGAVRGGARGTFRSARGVTRGATRGARGASRGTRGRGGRGGAKKMPSVAELDAELDAYANQASK